MTCEANKYHQTLANYFLGKSLYLDKSNNRNPNIRKLIEQPWQQTKTEVWEELEQTLCDLEFIEAKCTAGMAYSLFDDYKIALGSSQETHNWSGRHNIEDFSTFFQSELHVLARFPALTFQQAANGIFDTIPEQAARVKLSQNLTLPPWLRLVNKTESSSRPVVVLAGHENDVVDCEFSPDDHHIVSADSTGIYLWDAASGELLMTHPVKGVQEIGFSNDGSHIVANTLHNKVQMRFGQPRHVMVNALRIHDAKSLLEIAVNYGQVWFRGTFSFEGNKHAGISIMTKNNLRIWNASIDATIGCIPLSIWRMSAGFGGSHMQLSPSGDRLAYVKSDNEISIFNNSTGEIMATLDGHRGIVTSLVFSPDGMRLASGSTRVSVNEEENQVIVWDLETFKELSRFKKHSSTVRALAFSPDGCILASASGREDSTVKIWNWATDSVLGTLHCPGCDICWCEFSQNGKFLAVVSQYSSDLLSSRQLSVCDAGSHPGGPIYNFEMIWRIEAGGFFSEVTAAFAPDSMRIITSGMISATPKLSYFHQPGNDGQLRLFRTSDGEQILDMISENRGYGPIKLCAFSHDGARIAALNSDGSRLTLWDSFGGKNLKLLEADPFGFVSFRFVDPSGDLVIVIEENHFEIWNPMTNTRVASMAEIPRFATLQALSPDLKRYVILSAGQIEVRDIANGAICGKYTEVDSENKKFEVKSIAFSPDGNLLAVISSNGLTLLNSINCALIKQVHQASGIVTFSTDGSRILTHGPCVWDTFNPSEPTQVGESPRFSHSSKCRFSSNSRLVASCNEKQVAVWRSDGSNYTDKLSSKKTSPLQELVDQYVHSCHFSPDGSRVLITNASTDIKMIDVTNGKLLSPLSAKGEVSNARLSPDGQSLLTVTDQFISLSSLANMAVIRSWDMKTFDNTSIFMDDAIFSPDGQTLLVSTLGESLYLCEHETGKPPIQLPGHTNGVWKWKAFLEDGKSIITGDGKTTRFFSCTTGKMMWEIPASSKRSDFVKSMGRQPVVYPKALGPNGIIVINEPGSFDVWDVQNRSFCFSLPSDEADPIVDCSCDISPDGFYLAAARNRQLSLWQLSNGVICWSTEIEEFKEIKFSPNCEFLAISGSNNLRILRLIDGKEIYRYMLSTEICRNTLEWNPCNGRQLVFGDWQDRTYLLRLE